MRGSVVNQLNGGSGGKLQVASRARKHMLSWMETPEDFLFLATDSIRLVNKLILQLYCIVLVDLYSANHCITPIRVTPCARDPEKVRL